MLIINHTSLIIFIEADNSIVCAQPDITVIALKNTMNCPVRNLIDNFIRTVCSIMSRLNANNVQDRNFLCLNIPVSFLSVIIALLYTILIHLSRRRADTCVSPSKQISWST